MAGEHAFVGMTLNGVEDVEVVLQARAIAFETGAALDEFEMWGHEAALVFQALALAEVHRGEPDVLARCSRANYDLAAFRRLSNGN